jgi:short-subunit dehydrogenase
MTAPLIVVTGGTKGIGRAILERFASEGFALAVCARSKSDLAELKKDLTNRFSCEVFVQSCDMSVREDTREFIAFVRRIGRPVEVLVNNAGVFIPGSIHDEEAGALEKMIETNLYSAYDLTRGLIGEMMERKHGHVFNICSVASIMAYPNGGSYAISKHAMYGFSRCLREEMKPHGVRVTAVLPGATLTASWAGVDLPPERFSKPEDVAEMVYAAYRISPQSVTEDIVIRPQEGDL